MGGVFSQKHSSNRCVEGKTLDLTLSLPFQDVANRFSNTYGALNRDIGRKTDGEVADSNNFTSSIRNIRKIWDELFPKLVGFFKSHSTTVVLENKNHQP